MLQRFLSLNYRPKSQSLSIDGSDKKVRSIDNLFGDGHGILSEYACIVYIEMVIEFINRGVFYLFEWLRFFLVFIISCVACLLIDIETVIFFRFANDMIQLLTFK